VFVLLFEWGAGGFSRAKIQRNKLDFVLCCVNKFFFSLISNNKRNKRFAKKKEEEACLVT